jgi:hypothetical protein
MRPLTIPEIRDSMVNATEAEIEHMPMPGLHEMVWEEREYLGWRDPSSAHRGYLVYWRGDRAVGLVLRAATSPLKAGAAICSLCSTGQPGGQVTLFSAPRAGEAGRRGDSVGTYICADLSCSLLIRIAPRSYEQLGRPGEVLARKSRRLETRLDAFVSRVLEDAR